LVKKKNTKVGLFIGTIIFGGLGILLMFSWIQSMQMARASKSWPSVSGKITSSKVMKVLESTDKKGKKHYTYPAQIKYNYTVEGQNHVGSRISFGDYSSNTPGHAEGIVKNYPAEKNVRVYYDPDFPVQAVLERRVGFGNFITVIVGILFVLGGLTLLFAFFVKLFTGR